MALFWYKRKVKEEKEVDGEGKDEGKKVKKTVEVTYWDCLNTECIVRGIWFTDKSFAVLLNDGHEQATEQQVPVKNKNNGVSMEIQRRRDWHYSQIDLDEEDTRRLWTGKMHPSFKETEEAVAVD